MKKISFLPKDRASFALSFYAIWSLVNCCYDNKIFIGTVFFENLLVAVDHHGWDIFVFDFIMIYCVPLKNQIYQKMQCEKLYNLWSTIYFIVALFWFGNERNSERLDFDVAKMRFFRVKNRFLPSYLIFLLSNTFVYKKKLHHAMQREKLYKLQRTITEKLNKKERIRLSPKKHLIFTTSKSRRSEFHSFSKQKSATIK